MPAATGVGRPAPFGAARAAAAAYASARCRWAPSERSASARSSPFGSTPISSKRAIHRSRWRLVAISASWRRLPRKLRPRPLVSVRRRFLASSSVGTSGAWRPAPPAAAASLRCCAASSFLSSSPTTSSIVDVTPKPCPADTVRRPPAPICTPCGASDARCALGFETLAVSAACATSRAPPSASASAVAASPSDVVVACPCALPVVEPSTSRRLLGRRCLRLGSPECGALTPSVTFSAQAAKFATLCTRLGRALHCRPSALAASASSRPSVVTSAAVSEPCSVGTTRRSPAPACTSTVVFRGAPSCAAALAPAANDVSRACPWLSTVSPVGHPSTKVHPSRRGVPVSPWGVFLPETGAGPPGSPPERA